MIDNKHNYGIDVLRIVSMLLILILHICLQGGVLYGIPLTSGLKYGTAWFIESLSYGAVNCYALITGYVMYKPSDGTPKSCKYYKIFVLYLQVLFYSLGITGIFALIKPEAITFERIMSAFLPVTNIQYWYFTAYFGMFFFIPFFDKLIGTLSDKQFIGLIATMFVLFSFIPFVLSDKADPFTLNNGYSMLWLSVLYFGGAFIRRFEDKIKIKKLAYIAAYFICSAIPCICSLTLDSTSDTENMAAEQLGGYLYKYTSPFTVIAAISLFMIFKDINIKSSAVQKAVKILSASSFGVYLIHVHPLVFDNVVDSAFAGFAASNTVLMAAEIIAASIAAYVLRTLIEYGRIMLFRLLRVEKLCEKAVEATIKFVTGLKIKN